MADTSELLRALIAIKATELDTCEEIAAALSSRLQAEAPAELPPHEHLTWDNCPHEHKGCLDCGAPTLKAEAQAPAVTLMEDERRTIEEVNLYGRAGATSNHLVWELLAIIRRLTAKGATP